MGQASRARDKRHARKTLQATLQTYAGQAFATTRKEEKKVRLFQVQLRRDVGVGVGGCREIHIRSSSLVVQRCVYHEMRSGLSWPPLPVVD